jgi:cation transporter-like permease
MLAGWALRFDEMKRKMMGLDSTSSTSTSIPAAESKPASIFSSSVVGYGIGCFLCELFQTGQGQPALLFIVPAMLASVGAVGSVSGQLSDMWSYDPMKKEEDTNR